MSLVKRCTSTEARGNVPGISFAVVLFSEGRVKMKIITFDLIDTLVGMSLGTTRRVVLSQAEINAFADITNDRQWIHVDPEAAAKSSFGSTIVHGYLTLSLLPGFARELITIEGTDSIVNYGLNRVRFPRPIRVGAAMRDHIRVVAVEPNHQGKHLILEHEVEVAGEQVPACIAETVSLLRPDAGRSGSKG